MPTPEVKEDFVVYPQEGFLGVKWEGAPPRNKCRHAPIGLCIGIHLRKKLYMHLGEGPWTVRCEERNQTTGQMQTKIPKDCPI